MKGFARRFIVMDKEEALKIFMVDKNGGIDYVCCVYKCSGRNIIRSS